MKISPRFPRLPRRLAAARIFHMACLLYLALMGWERFSLALRERDLIEALGAEPGPDYIAASGAAWGVICLAAAALLYIPRRWARIAAFCAGVLVGLAYWADRLAFSHQQANWAFAVLMTLVLWSFSASLMILLDQWEGPYGKQRGS